MAFLRRYGAAAFFLLLALFAGVCKPAAAQTYTAVTGTITDPNGVPYSFATITFQLTPHQGQATVTPCPQSPCPVPNPGSVQTNAAGFFSTTLLANGSILPGGTQWIVGVVEPGVPLPWGTGPQQFSYTVTIAGASQSLSAALSALAPALTQPFIPSGGAVTSVTATPPIVSSGGPTPNISCPTCVRTDPPAAQNIVATPSNFPLSISATGSLFLPGVYLLGSQFQLPATTLPASTQYEAVGGLDYIPAGVTLGNQDLFTGGKFESGYFGSGGLNLSTISGLSAQGEDIGSGSTPGQGVVQGGIFLAENSGDTIGQIEALVTQSNNFSGSASQSYGLFIQSPSGGTGGTVTTSYGIYMQDLSTGGTTYTNPPIGIYEAKAGMPNTLGNLILTGVATSPSPNPLCPNGTNGTITQSGCTVGDVNNAFISTLLAGNIPSTGTNPGGSPVTIASVTIPTADFAGCGTNGCRIGYDYSYSIAGGTEGVCYVSDGTNTYGLSLALTVNNFTPCGKSGMSLTKFSAGANPTVTVTLYDIGTTEVCQYQSLTPSAAGCASGASGATQGYVNFYVQQSN